MQVGWPDSAVLPMGCHPNEPRSESEKVDPVAVVVVGVEVFVLDELKDMNDEVVGCGACVVPVPPVRNEDATLVKVVVGKPVG